MIKILRVINRLNLGGPTYNVAYLTKYLPDNFETKLLTGMRDEDEASSEFITGEMGIQPVPVAEMFRDISLLSDRRALRKIKHIIKDYRPDIVHTHAAKSGALGRWAASDLKVPVIVHTFHGHVFHSYFSPLKTRVFIEIERQLAKRSTAIVAISEKQKQELGEIYRIAPMEKIHVIPLGFDLHRFQHNQAEKRTAFRKKYMIDDDEIVISIIGRMVPIKNHKLFIDAVQYLQKNSSKRFRAFIVGDGEERANIEGYLNQSKLDYTDFTQNPRKATVTLTSWIREADVVNAGSDIIALTSLNEGTPVSLIEAQASNNPVITTDVGGIADVVLHGKTGYVSELDQPENFYTYLHELVEDNDLRARMGNHGYVHVKDKYSYERLVNDMSHLYENLLGVKHAHKAKIKIA